MDPRLRTFWIIPRGALQTRGFGVTAFSPEDALRILDEGGYELPEDRSALEITPDVRPTDLDQKHINCGPFVVRVVWYPFIKVGV